MPGDGDPGDGLTVVGGAGSVAAAVEDLLAWARVLHALGSTLLAAGARLAARAADPVFAASAVASPLTAALVEARLVVALTGPHGVVTCGSRFELLATGLVAAAHTYDAAETAARWSVHEAELAAGRVAGEVARPVVLAAVAVGAVAVAGRVEAAEPVGAPALGGLLGRAAAPGEHVVAAVPGFLGGLLGPAAPLGLLGAARAGIPWPPRDMPQVAGLAAALAAGVGTGTPLLRAGPGVAVRTETVPVAPARGLADVATRVAACYPGSGSAPGTLTVEAVTGPDGRRAWVVEVPGTQVWSPVPGPNPFDLTTNVHALAGRPAAVGAAVVAGLTAAGARPGEPVLLAGHSQGGMVAAGLATDPAFRRRFSVTHVVTMGSPVAAARVPPGVGVLSLEHDEDLVPRLDGQPNPRTAHWLTASRSAGNRDGAPADAIAAHGALAYVRSAALVDASADPGLRRFRAGLAPFLDGPGVVARRTTVVAVRSPAVPVPP